MSIAVISYSYTGNNKALADSVAKKLSAEHIQITEQKKRTMGTIIFDVLFNRTPRVSPAPNIIEKHDMILFFSPIWMGMAAFPMRAYLKYLKENPKKYGFVSISGGAVNGNPTIEGNLEKLAGRKPEALIDLHISDLLPSHLKSDMKATSSYKLSENDIEALTNKIIKELEAIL